MAIPKVKPGNQENRLVFFDIRPGSLTGAFLGRAMWFSLPLLISSINLAPLISHLRSQVWVKFLQE